MPRLLSLLLLAAVSTHLWAKPAPDATITITSEPSGAAVYTMGKKRGVTPATFRLKDVLPALYKPEQLRMGTQVFVKMKGCETAYFPINRREIPESIHAELECESVPVVSTPTAAPATAAPAATATPAPSTAPAPAATPAAPAQPPARPAITPVEEPKFQFSTIREKLKELEQLREDGLISEEEYQQLRKRVLGYF